MGHHNAGYADFLQRIDQLELGLLAQFFVERAQGFVQEQELRPLGQRACQGDALLLAARELVRLALGVLRHLHQPQHFFYAGGDFVLGHFVLLQAVGDVLLHRHVRKQRVALEHHIDGALVGRQGGDVLAVENNVARRRRFHAGEHAQQRRFAATRAAEQGEDFVLLDIQVDVVDGGVVAEFFHQTFDLQIGWFASHGQCSIRTKCGRHAPNRRCGVETLAVRLLWTADDC